MMETSPMVPNDMDWEATSSHRPTRSLERPRMAASRKKIEAKWDKPVMPDRAALELVLAHSFGRGMAACWEMLDEDSLRSILSTYESMFWTRPWAARERSEAERLFSTECYCVEDLSKLLGREEDDVRRSLGIHDGCELVSEDLIRELERSMLKGHCVLCDVENWGATVYTSPVAAMPGQFGFTGGRPVCEFPQLPSRLKEMMIRRRCVNDPENALGWGVLTFNENM